MIRELNKKTAFIHSTPNLEKYEILSFLLNTDVDM